ncbi:SnoaL-like domain-containing protein [Aureimonas altamirensis DSM 21988]|uniref:SnoaL-like polyketide cyclase n=2 Tax=Aureimonas altamirensis TaxID=370622 RepID=A0A0P0YVK0_9HYPH|nr:nuclear transport factor 2 family protein [Aureimonas altamirensis]BAT25488.1 SnoaL-like polyketide cyclase [Aureimonas altamirensis]SHK02451.1 SnoaL-like domain-containing protein [Aureimonas altamirensis DSM 21988]
MRDNETIIRELYDLAEGEGSDMERFVAAFSDDGYLTDIPTGATLRGRAIGDYIGRLTTAFPDIHRELSKLYTAGDVVVVELAIRGTHLGDLVLPSGTLAPTGLTIDVPCCDVCSTWRTARSRHSTATMPRPSLRSSLGSKVDNPSP